ncbi:SIR2 family protein, partial [Rivihabitans pingtungensis]
MSEKILYEWTEAGLLEEMQQLHQYRTDRRLAFILGAGASVSSKIPAGGYLAEKWLKESYRREQYNITCSLEEWARITFGNHDFTLEDAANYYPKIFDLRFRDHASGFAALEEAMRDAKPNIGYSVLAKILDKTRHNVVVTTNFDNLVADAMAIHAQRQPLIVGHETLAHFARPPLSRALVAKIHRDLYLQPKNDTQSVNAMDLGWKNSLTQLFQHYTPLVLGYGGNDNGLIDFLKSADQINGTVYWCYHRASEKPKNRDIYDVISKHKGVFVAIESFDDFMIKLGQALMPEHISIRRLIQDIDERAKDQKERYQNSWADLGYGIADQGIKPQPHEDNNAVSLEKQVKLNKNPIKNPKIELNKTHGIEQDWGDVVQKIRSEPDITTQLEQYLTALKRFNQKGFVLYFMQDLDSCALPDNEKEKYYRRAHSLLSANSVLLMRFAKFLSQHSARHDEAEVLYKQAAEQDNTLDSLTEIAEFLDFSRKKYDQAESYYRRCLENHPDSSAAHINLAGFMTYRRNNLDYASELYAQALKLKEGEKNHGEYASFKYQCKNYGVAKYHFGIALEGKAVHVETLVNYACMLLTQKKEESAQEAYEKLMAALERHVQASSRNYTQSLAETYFYLAICHELKKIKAQTYLEPVLNYPIAVKSKPHGKPQTLPIRCQRRRMG